MIKDFKEKLIQDKIKDIGKALMVCSGKGGVGKSTIAYAIARAASIQGVIVGLLDLDIHGPVQHVLFGKVKKLTGGKEGINPIELDGIKVFSLGFISKEEPISIKGDQKEDLLRNIFSEINFGRLELLIIDMPPGSEEEIVFLSREFRSKLSSVVVTTSSLLSIEVVKRTIKLLKNENVQILGLIENFFYSRDGIRLFGSSNVNKLEVPLIGRIPFDPNLEEALIKGKIEEAKDFWSSILEISRKILKEIL